MQRLELPKLSFIILLIYALGYPILSGTIYWSSILGYLSFVILFLVFLFFYLKNRNISTPGEAKLWVPFVLLTIFGYTLHGKIQPAVNWFVALVLLFVGQNSKLETNFPHKLLLFFGLFISTGIAVQMFLPSLYNSIILPKIVFQEHDLYNFGLEGVGLNGFTNQTAISAIVLLYAEAVSLYFYKNKWGKILTVVFILCIFLTGKKTMSLVSIIVPFLMYFIARRISAKNFALFTILLIGGMVAVNYFLSNFSLFSDSLILRRFSKSADVATSGESIFYNRLFLYDYALSAFSKNPVFGVGVGQFMSYTHASTHVHNMYLQVLCEQGIIGITLFIIPLVSCLKNTIKKYRNYAENDQYSILLSISIYIQLVFVLYGITGNPSVDPFGYMMYFAAISLSEANVIKQSI